MIWSEIVRKATAEAAQIEETMAKVNVILGTTETPAWARAKLARMTAIPLVPVESDGLPGSFLRTPSPGEAAERLLAEIMAWPERGAR